MAAVLGLKQSGDNHISSSGAQPGHMQSKAWPGAPDVGKYPELLQGSDTPGTPVQRGAGAWPELPASPGPWGR